MPKLIPTNQKLFEAFGKLRGSEFSEILAFSGLRIAVATILLISSFLESGKAGMSLLVWLAIYIVISSLAMAISKRLYRYSWAYLVVIIPETFFIINIFTHFGSLESYLVYAYFFLIATSSFSFGIKGSVTMAALITGFDYVYTHLPENQSLHSPVVFRIGLSWVAALAFGFASRNITESHEKIQQLNKKLNSINEDLNGKVTVLVNASRVLGSINNLDNLILYFQETLMRIFKITEHVLIVKPDRESDPFVVSNVGVDEFSLSEDLVNIKEEMLITNISFSSLGLSIGATHKGTQGFYLLLVRGNEVQALLTDKDIFESIFGQFILAIDNALLLRKVKEASLTDHLTGLYNQRYFYDRIQEEINRAQRNGSNLSILMIDVDNFKNYNDLYGHLNGDKALAKVAAVISASCREIDVAARYGGEEFVVVLPDTSGEGAIEVAGRIINGVRDERFPGFPDKPEVSLSVSIGVASFPKHGLEVLEVIERADKALYKAKELGKDRYVVARKKRSVKNLKEQRDLKGA